MSPACSTPFGIKDQFSISLYVTDKIRARLAEREISYSITEVMNDLAGSNSWNPAEMVKLADYSDDDFYDWLLSDQSDNLLTLIGEFIDRFNNDENEIERTVVERIKIALNKVSERSPIDQLRVEKFIGYKKT